MNEYIHNTVYNMDKDSFISYITEFKHRFRDINSYKLLKKINKEYSDLTVNLVCEIKYDCMIKYLFDVPVIKKNYEYDGVEKYYYNPSILFYLLEKGIATPSECIINDYGGTNYEFITKYKNDLENMTDNNILDMWCYSYHYILSLSIIHCMSENFLKTIMKKGSITHIDYLLQHNFNLLTPQIYRKIYEHSIYACKIITTINPGYSVDGNSFSPQFTFDDIITVYGKNSEHYDDCSAIHNDLCAVCYCNVPDIKLKCSHTFCKKCINNLYVDDLPNCPLCNKNFTCCYEI